MFVYVSRFQTHNQMSQVMSRRALEKVVDRTARAYLAKLGCCPPDVSAADGAEGDYWHAAFEEEVARAVRNSLAKQGIGPPCKPQVWLLEAKAASKAAAAAAAAAAEAKLTKAGTALNSKGAVGEANSSSSKANGSSTKGASSSSSSSSQVDDAGAASMANGAQTGSGDSSGAGADPAGKDPGTGAVRIYRDDSSGASSSSGEVKRRSPSRPPAAASVSTVRSELVRQAIACWHCLHCSLYKHPTTGVQPAPLRPWLWIYDGSNTRCAIRLGGRFRLQITMGGRPPATGSGRLLTPSWRIGSAASTRG